MSNGLNVGKVRKAEGIFIFGIKLKQDINNPDYILGGTLSGSSNPSASFDSGASNQETTITGEIETDMGDPAPVSNETDTGDLAPVSNEGVEVPSHKGDEGDEGDEASLSKRNRGRPRIHPPKEKSNRSRGRPPKTLPAQLNTTKSFEQVVPYREFTPRIVNFETTKREKDIYNTYISFLTELTPLKSAMDKEVKQIENSQVESLLNGFLVETRALEVATTEYKEGIRDTLHRNVRNLHMYGCFPKQFIHLGNSPRIVPKEYSKSLNSTKKVLRNYVYKKVSQVAKSHGYVIVDFDLKACYTSILMGMYPLELEYLKNALDRGLWKSIEQDFVDNNINQYYHKTSVKVCLYASLFLGGVNAMTKGILNSFRLECGVTKKQYENSEIFHHHKEIAHNVVEFMSNHRVILDFRGLAKKIRKDYDSLKLCGPTGHKYVVDDVEFMSSFPNFLQSYEFSILAQSIIRLKELHPRIQLLHHFHDGAVIALEADKYKEQIELFKSIVTYRGFELGLAYPQQVEVQNVFDTLLSTDVTALEKAPKQNHLTYYELQRAKIARRKT